MAGPAGERRARRLPGDDLTVQSAHPPSPHPPSPSWQVRWRRSRVHRDWRRDRCLSAATSVLDQVLVIDRHLQHAVDLLGDQPFSDHPAWTYALVSVSCPDGVEELIDPVRLAFL